MVLFCLFVMGPIADEEVDYEFEAGRAAAIEVDEGEALSPATGSSSAHLL